MKKLVQSLMVCGYILMATLTGRSPERQYGMNEVFPENFEWAGANAIHDVFWYAPYQYRHKAGNTEQFFPRGHLYTWL